MMNVGNAGGTFWVRCLRLFIVDSATFELNSSLSL